MPLLNTSGNVTADAYAGGVAAIPKYIEDYFSTFLYQGTGATQSITNNIDLSTKGGMVWAKARSGTYSTATGPVLFDTARGVGNAIFSNYTGAQANYSNTLTAFNTSGFSLGADAVNTINGTGTQYASWSFAKAPKFFDVVTYIGNGATQNIAHSLGSVPGCIIVKRIDAAQNWAVYHQSLGNTKYLSLNSTNAQLTSADLWNSTTPTSTQFSVGADSFTNSDGYTYVAYLFAHNAGGFGLTGTDNVISCGLFTPDSSGNVDVNLGYEPQWILFKRSATVGSWSIADTMRGMSYSDFNRLYANLSNAEDAQPAAYCVPTATGFKSVTTGVFSANEPHIYIAIRRGPMKVPTTGTSVFKPTVGLDGTSPISTGFPVDMFFDAERSGSAINTSVGSRLTGNQKGLITSSTSAELDTIGASVCWTNNTGYTPFVFGSSTGVQYAFRRAPSFFDEVCYTGTGSARTVAHNLAVVPELMIVKNRSGVSEWTTYQAPIGASQVMRLNSTIAAFTDASVWNGTAPTSSVFSIGTSGRSNDAGSTFVIYLFASCPGVSKVGSYTGTGATQTINCGFTGGARFVLIKRTDSTGNWGVLDTARGMVSGTDPYLNLNTTAAEVNANNVYTTTGGFQLVSSDANFNASGGTYIFLAVA